MEAFPDLAKLDDAALGAVIEELEQREQAVSFERRILHGKIDILRAERVARLKATPGAAAQLAEERFPRRA
jgi:RsiG-like